MSVFAVDSTHMVAPTRSLSTTWVLEPIHDVACFRPDVFRKLFGEPKRARLAALKKFNKRKQQRRATCGYRRK